MKRFQLFIELENDAFEGEKRDSEIIAILRAVANRLEENIFSDLSYYQNLHDSNGNSVGQFAIKDQELKVVSEQPVKVSKLI